MPTNYRGDVTKIRVSAVADRTTFNPATATQTPLYTRSADLSVSRETFAFDPEFESVDGAWGEGEETTQRGWSVSFDGYYHPGDLGYLIVENAVWRETEAGVAQAEIIYVWFYPTGNAVGQRFRHGFCRPEELGMPSDRGGSVDSSFALNGAGKLNRATVA